MNGGLSRRDEIYALLEHQLVVSCQPVERGPLDRTDFIVAMAAAAVAGGAKGLRIEGAANVEAVARDSRVPIIGIVKHDPAGSGVRITPLQEDVDALAAAGAEIIAIDATTRARPVPFCDLVHRAHNHGRLVMADCSDLDEAKLAVQLGCDIVGSTLSGYTGGEVPGEPDLELIEQMADLDVRVMAEGRIRTPHQAAMALERGAWSVTVGSAITRVEHITSWFAMALGGVKR